MPELSQRAKTMESISRSSIHQSLATSGSHVALARARTSTLTDPAIALDNLRAMLQPNINQGVEKVIKKYIDTYFSLALANARNNLGDDKVDSKLLDEVCLNVLENAKVIFDRKEKSNIKKKVKSRKKKKELKVMPKVEEENKKPRIANKIMKPNTDLILVTKYGKPVRREGPKWDPSRLHEDTLFILGSRANKALGFGQTRGRLYTKHPELFKYSGDQEDKEWLAKNQVMTTTGGKAFLMVLQDIMELSRTTEYASHPRQQPNELLGFTVPFFMIEKMKLFTQFVKTDSNIPDDQLITKGEEQIALWEEERKKILDKNTARLAHCNPTPNDSLATAGVNSDDALYMQEILNEMKKEHPSDTNNEDELGFLHGMNLNNLVREFEMETANGNGNQSLGILSLADDNAEETFPELAEVGDMAQENETIAKHVNLNQ